MTLLRVFVWLLCVVVATLPPFDFAATPITSPTGLHLFRYSSGAGDVLVNVILFIPLGALLWHQRQRRSYQTAVVMLLAGALGCGISVIIEYLQAFLPSRDSSLIDVVSNTAGAIIGVWGHRVWGTYVETRLARWRTPAVLVRSIVGFTVVALTITAMLQLQTRLENWDEDYPLVLGNERTGDRPWRGRIFALELSDAAASSRSVARFAAGEHLQLPGRRIADFDFNGIPPYRDATGNLPSLGWVQGYHHSGGSGIKLPGRPWLQTERPTTAIARHLGETGAFTLRVLCATDDVHQVGPARIVTNSIDTGRRNFTLGQRGGDMVVRVRTSVTGPNGVRPEIVIRDVFANNEQRDILVTYDGARLLAALSDSKRVSRTELMFASPLATTLLARDATAEELQMVKILNIGILFAVAGALVGLLTHTMRERLLFGLGWVSVFTLLLEGTLVLTSGRPLSWSNVGMIGLLGSALVTLVSIALATTNVRGSRPVDELLPA